MATYVVIRHGSNAANQSMCMRAVLGLQEAPSHTKARELVAQRFTCYNNQHFELVPVSQARAADKRQAEQEEGLREPYD